MAKKILVETSARHVHLTKEAVEILFGAGHELTNKKDLSQPGQFACEEKVTVTGPKGSLKASILGPTRPANQVELSLTDARAIGVVAPVRESGDVAGSGSKRRPDRSRGKNSPVDCFLAGGRPPPSAPEKAASSEAAFSMK